jgi:acyl-CoA reductase-like NAD-dependent aldehyde dehydrogenase
MERANIGRLLSREEGKTLPEGIGETVRAGRILKYFAGEALRRHGQNLASTRPGVEIQTYRQAVGVFGLITPWNFPIAIPAWKAAPALAFGNTVVMKPAGPTPATASALADILHRGGLPKGVFNMVIGRGGVVRPSSTTRTSTASPSPARRRRRGRGRSARSSVRPACSWRWAARTR